MLKYNTTCYNSNPEINTCWQVHLYTAISRKVVKKNMHTIIPKGNMGYDQYTVPNDCIAVEPTFFAFH